MSQTNRWTERLRALDGALDDRDTDALLRILDEMITALAEENSGGGFRTQAIPKLLTAQSLAREVPAERLRSYFDEKVRPHLPL